SETYNKERFGRLRTELTDEVSKFQQLLKLGPAEGLDSELTRSKERIETILGFFEFGESLTLRPEATASVCRAYIEHNMQQLPQPVKLYYMGPMFRRERPQKGRYRQFYQIGAEVLEVVRREVAEHDWEKEVRKDAAIDAEVIEMLMTFFAKLELA